MKSIFYKKLLMGILGLASLYQVQAQDLHFSQFFEAPLLRNPSLAGIFTGDVRVQGVYRDQWNSFTNAYRTGSLNAEYKMPVGVSNDFITTGIQMLYDKAGTVGLTTSQVLPALNYHKSLSNDKVAYLSLGFMGGLIHKSIDVTKMTTNNQYNGQWTPTASTGETFAVPNFNTWDASVGMSYNTTFGTNGANTMFLGAAYHHLNKPKNSFYRDATTGLNPKYVFSAGVKWVVDDYSYFTMYADHSKQGTVNETIAGGLYSFNPGNFVDDANCVLHVGGFLRWKDAFIPVVKVDMRSLSVALSYDVNVSQLKTASQGRGGFELSLSYIGFLHRDDAVRDEVMCPRF
jgi:type IX secretion system PorP/SprF family membrane protein